MVSKNLREIKKNERDQNGVKPVDPKKQQCILLPMLEWNDVRFKGRFNNNNDSMRVPMALAWVIYENYAKKPFAYFANTTASQAINK